MARAVVGVGLLILIYLGFISLGMPDGILGAAWPAMRGDLGLGLSANWPMMLAVTVGGAVSSFVSGRVLARFGTGRVLAASCLLTGGCILGYSVAPSWWLIVALALPFGAGAGAVDAGMNSFVARHLSSRIMNWLHAFWGVGVSAGTMMLSAVFVLGGTWRTAYFVIAVVQLGLCVLFFVTLRRWDIGEGEGETATDAPLRNTTSLWATLRLPASQGSLLVFLAYAGVECNFGIWSVSVMVEHFGVAAAQAAIFVSAYWGALTLGRFVLGAAANRLGNRRLFVISAAGITAGAAVFTVAALVHGTSPIALCAAVCGMVFAGFFCGPIYPCTMHDTPRRVAPEHTQNLIGMQVGTAIVGVAALPILSGFVLELCGLWLLGPLILACGGGLLVLSRVVYKSG